MSEDSDLLEYYAGIKVSEISALTDGMTCIDIPAAKYARFTHRGDTKNIDNTVNYAYSSWLLTSGYRHNIGPDLETYCTEYDAVSDKSIMYYSLPVI